MRAGPGIRRRAVAVAAIAHTAEVTRERVDLTLGFGLPVAGSWARPEHVAMFARRAEELGYGSLWTFQRLLAPADAEMPPQYRSVLDPVVPLAYAAAVTERVRLGTAIVNAPFYPPAILAKELTTVDVLSGGRLDVGLAVGWVPEEFTAAGVSAERRGARTGEVHRLPAGALGGRPRGVPRQSSTTSRGRGWSRSRCSGRTRRCCSGVPRSRPCAARDGSPTAGSAAAATT